MEQVSVKGLPMMYAGDIDGVCTKEREWERDAFAASATYQIYGEPWRRHIEKNRRALSFSEGKQLAHRAVDEMKLPRPFVKCMPLHYRCLGYATAEWEIFTQRETWDDTVLHEAAHLMSWERAGEERGIMEGHSLTWFSNYVVLLLQFGQIAAAHVNAFALNVISDFGPRFPEDFEFALRARVEGHQEHWASLKRGDPDYHVAISAGCYLHSVHRQEPLPHRDA